MAKIISAFYRTVTIPALSSKKDMVDDPETAPEITPQTLEEAVHVTIAWMRLSASAVQATLKTIWTNIVIMIALVLFSLMAFAIKVIMSLINQEYFVSAGEALCIIFLGCALLTSLYTSYAIVHTASIIATNAQQAYGTSNP